MMHGNTKIKFIKPKLRKLDMIPLSGKNVGRYTFTFAPYYELFLNPGLQKSYKFSVGYILIF